MDALAFLGALCAVSALAFIVLAGAAVALMVVLAASSWAVAAAIDWLLEIADH